MIVNHKIVNKSVQSIEFKSYYWDKKNKENGTRTNHPYSGKLDYRGATSPLKHILHTLSTYS